MNHLKRIAYFLLLINLCSCTNQKLVKDKIIQIDVEIFSPTYPVLIGKQNNQLAQLNIKVFDSVNTKKLNSISIKFDGELASEKIKNIKVYIVDDKKSFMESNNLFSLEDIGKANMIMRGNQKLDFGDNLFWITGELVHTANLEEEFNITLKSIEVNNDKIPILKNNTFEKRIGHALRKHNDDNVHTYRIPGLVTTNKGTLIAVYDMRRNGSVDLQEDVDIGMNRSTDGGQTWSSMKVIMDMKEWGGLPNEQNGIGDPSILVDRITNTIWVAGIWAHGHPGKRNWWASRPGMTPETTSQLVLVKSEDDGLTWSDPINITKQIKDKKWHLLLQGPGKGITMKDGTLVFPAQFKDEDQMPHSTIIFSKDRGETWKIGTGAKSNTTEAQVVELSNGSLMLNMRDNRGNGPDGKTGLGARSVYITKDLGSTWSKHPTSFEVLPEPVCMASLIDHSYEESGKLKSILLFSNPFDRSTRKSFTIKASFDEGMTWPEEYFTLIDEGQGRGYSCLTSIGQDQIGILYEGSQADLVFQKFQLSDLLKK